MTSNQIYLYWALIGLILESRFLGHSNRSINMELSKRILRKIDHNFVESKLAIEYKHLNVTVYQMSQDYLGLIKSLELQCAIDPSDYVNLKIEANINLGKFEEAKAICLTHIKSHNFIDMKIWLLFLGILDRFEDGVSIAYTLIESCESKYDSRGLKCAALELKLKYKDVFFKSAADMLFDYCIDLLKSHLLLMILYIF